MIITDGNGGVSGATVSTDDAISINIKFDDPNTNSSSERGYARNNVDTVDVKGEEGSGVKSDSDEHEGKDAGEKREEVTKGVVDEILGFDAGLWKELSDLSNLRRS
ncbi:hypothetical protein B0H65DRAFT_87244 [Neurospora tetraspora]|uniref:Uncharacterized protein n=1 Tax=Neurospora tetraspora TaxID=94610 RepID=A0AAE0MUX0_9PEZI|nr:hypothetical protein B0H65DRAFT_87244 [Neurospora tetraspora]